MSDEQDYQDYLDYQDYQKYQASQSNTSDVEGRGPSVFDFGSSVAKDFAYGAGAEGGAVIGAAQDAIDWIPDNSFSQVPIVGPVLEGLADLSRAHPTFGRDTYRQGRQLQQQTREDLNLEPGGMGEFGYDVATGVSRLIPALAAGPAALVVALEQGLRSGSSKYQDLGERGATGAQRVGGAVTTGAVDALASLPQFQAVLGKTPGLFRRALQSTIGGAFGGALSPVGQAAGDYIGTGQRPEHLGSDIARGALVGGTTALAASGFGEVGARYRNQRQAAANEAQIAEFEKSLGAMAPESPAIPDVPVAPDTPVESAPIPVPVEQVVATPEAITPVEPSADIPLIAPESSPEIVPHSPLGDTSVVSGLETVEVPISRLKLSDDVPNFKSNANEKGVVRELRGKFDRRGVAPIIVWQRANGNLEVISGRHRFDLAQRSGEETIPAQIVRESDGVTKQHAAILDAELNIRDEQGSVKDYASYFRRSGISEAEAEARSLLSRDKGLLGYAIASKGSDALFDVHQAGRISDSQAAKIAEIAPGDEAVQRAGIKFALDGNSTQLISNKLQSLLHNSVREKQVQGDIFGSDDSAMKTADREGRIALRFQKELSERIASGRGAAKRPEQASELGVNVENPQETLQQLAKLRAEQSRWENWSLHPDLAEKVRAADAEALPLLRSERGSADLSTVKNTLDAVERFWTGKDKDFTSEDPSAPFFAGLRNVGTRALIYPKTLSEGPIGEAFPKVKEVWPAMRNQIETAHAVVSDLSGLAKRIDSLPAESQKKFGNFLSADRRMTKLRVQQGLEPREYTNAELTQAGLNPDEVGAYLAAREWSNKSLDLLQESLLARADRVAERLGPDAGEAYAQDVQDWVEALRRSHYVPFSRFGDYVVIEKTEGGGTGSRKHFESRAQAEKYAKEAKAKGLTVETKKLTKYDPDAYPDTPPGLEAGGKFDPATWTRQAGERPPQGYKRYLVEAALTQGESTDFARNIADYTLSLANFYAREKQAPVYREIVNSLPEGSAVRGHVERSFDAMQTDMPDAVRKIIATTNLWNIALNLGSPTANLTQKGNTIADTVMHVGFKKALPILGRAEKMTADYYMSKEFAKKNPELSAALDDASRRGVIDSSTYQELAGLRDGKKGFESVVGKTMWAFSEAEKYLRVNSYITGWEIGKTKGLKGPELAKFAEDLSWETQFDQSKANRPRIQQNWAGRTALLYRNYLGNQIRYLKNRAKTPEGRKAVGTYVAIQLSLGGVMGLIGVREVRNIARAFGVDVEDEFRQLLGKDKQTEAELVLYGAPTLANTNLSGMIGSGEFVPGATQGVYEAVGRTLAGPAIDLPAKAVKALQVYSQTGSELAAAKTAAPRFARNLLKAYEGATTGAIRDGSLEPQLQNPTPGELAQVAVGFTPQRMQRAVALKGAQMLTSANASDNDDINARYAFALISKDKDAQKAIREESRRNKNPINMRSVLDFTVKYRNPGRYRAKQAPRKARAELSRQAALYRD